MTFNFYMLFYLSGAGVYCIVLLLNKFKYQKGLKTTPISWLIIFMASTFWLVAIPISLLEIITKGKAKPYGRGKSGVAQETPDTKPD
jgi:RsiW-degrading membrane proteinase PrsW (M82 family)